MDPKQFKQWMEVAQSFHGQEFWKNIFNDNYGKQMMEGFLNDTQQGDAKGPVRPPSTSSDTDFPRYELFKSKDYYYVIIELPGIQKGDVDLSFTGDQIVIKGTVPSLRDRLKLVRSDRQIGEFERSIELPEPPDQSNIQAQFNNGLLEVKVGRSRSNYTPIQIK